MTFAEQMEERGILKGMQKGIHQGKQEGIQQGKQEGILEGEAKGKKEGKIEGKIEGEIRLLEKQIKLKFPDAKAVPLATLSLDQLELIGQRILTCDRLEEVLEGI